MYNPAQLFPAQVPTCLDVTMAVELDDIACMVAAQMNGTLNLYAYEGVLSLRVENFATTVPFEFGPMTGEVGKCSVN